MKCVAFTVLTAGLMIGLGGCSSTPEPIESSLNLPERPESTIPAIASIGTAGGTPSTIGSGRFTPAMFPENPDRATRRANQQAMQALRSSNIYVGGNNVPLPTPVEP